MPCQVPYKYGGATPGGGGGGSGTTDLAPVGGDNATQIVAAAPDVRLGPGIFPSAGGIVFPAKAAIEGRGSADHGYTTAITEITTPSATAEAVRFNAGPGRIEKLGIRNTLGADPSAGVGLRATSGLVGGGSGFR